MFLILSTNLVLLIKKKNPSIILKYIKLSHSDLMAFENNYTELDKSSLTSNKLELHA